jgi:SAM-dependent methyltransferase
MPQHPDLRGAERNRVQNQSAPSPSDNLAGIDYEFLRFIGVNREAQRSAHKFYLPFFEGCHSVLDLGCGDGTFVVMLQEKGIQAVGVDSDERFLAEAQAQGLDIVNADVFAFLETAEPGSFDGIFSAHLVEHLHYTDVIRLIRLAYRALRPGGRIVLVTPNVQGLYAHLDLFYLHFGHTRFYHPRLLCFFLEFAGFDQIDKGENPLFPSPLLYDLRLHPLSIPLLAPRHTTSHWWRFIGFLSKIQLLLTWIFLWPLIIRFEELIKRLDRPFESYATAVKPSASQARQR